MSKDAYYFSHDANARQDPKILEMMSVYGVEGYGRYWILVETLREQSDFTLKMNGKYTFSALAMQMHCKADASERFLHDCINEFALFESDGEYFWSDSLIKRMAIKEELSQKRKKAAEVRWGKKADKSTSDNENDASAMQLHSKSNAIGMQGKEIKEIKEIKKKRHYKDYVSMTDEEYKKLEDQFGKDGVEERMENLNLYKGSKGVKYKSDYMTILSWDRKEKKNKPKKKPTEADPYKSNSLDAHDDIEAMGGY